MAFSWNPFKRNTPLPQDESTSGVMGRNPNFNIFRGVNNDIERAVASRSIVGQKIQEQQPMANPVWQQFGFDDSTLALPIATNKAERIQQYRTIAKFPECQWCLDEIADEFIHEDELGEFIKLKLPDKKENLNETRKAIVREEFDRYINLFRLRDEGYNMIKRFLIEGELAWENVIKHDDPDRGIIGVKFLPSEYYETLLDAKTNRAIGLLFDTDKFSTDIHQILSNGYLGSAEVFNQIMPSGASFSFNKDTCIPMLWSQLTYINSGEMSYDGMISYPLIEKSKEAYHQLSLLQQSAVILRVTRAPERLLFNVSTGKMAQNYATEYVRNFANSLKSKKVAMPGGDVASVYNPVSMLESYVFGKSDGNDGTSIESVGGSADYEQLADIEYFLRRFMKQFKVPFSRYKTPENAPPTPDQLNYEEYSFLRMIVRFQRRFADGFKKGFITDLKLRGMWDKYEMQDKDIDISLVRPRMFDLYTKLQAEETKMNIYKAATENDEFSKTVAMKKFLDFTEADIKENFDSLIKEKMLTELADFYGGQVAEKKGLAGWESPIQFKADEDAENKPEKDGKKSDEGGDEEGGEEGEDEGGDEGGEEASAEPAEPATPTFGLG